MVLKSDNLGATFLASNTACHTKFKHVAIDLKYIRERVEVGSICVVYISGKLQQVDALTKALNPKMFIEQGSNLVKPLDLKLEGKC